MHTRSKLFNMLPHVVRLISSSMYFINCTNWPNG